MTFSWPYQSWKKPRFKARTFFGTYIKDISDQFQRIGKTMEKCKTIFKIQIQAALALLSFTLHTLCDVQKNSVLYMYYVFEILTLHSALFKVRKKLVQNVHFTQTFGKTKNRVK